MYELVFLGLALMVAPVLAKAAGHKPGGRHDWIGLGGLFFLVAAVTHVPLFEVNDGLVQIGHLMRVLAQGLGVILLLLGTVRGALEIFPVIPVPTR